MELKLKLICRRDFVITQVKVTYKEFRERNHKDAVSLGMAELVSGSSNF